MKRRKIPTLKLSMSSDIDYSEIIKIPGVADTVMEELVLAIKEGVTNKKKSISLFALADTDYYINIEKEQWVMSLNNALHYYVEIEDYNKCIECRDILNKLSYEQPFRKSCEES
jgi:hypothetical protein